MRAGALAGYRIRVDEQWNFYRHLGIYGQSVTGCRLEPPGGQIRNENALQRGIDLCQHGNAPDFAVLRYDCGNLDSLLRLAADEDTRNGLALSKRDRRSHQRGVADFLIALSEPKNPVARVRRKIFHRNHNGVYLSALEPRVD